MTVYQSVTKDLNFKSGMFCNCLIACIAPGYPRSESCKKVCMCAKRACRAFRQNCMLALLACVRPGTKRLAVLCITRLPPRKCTLPTVAAARLSAAPLIDYFLNKVQSLRWWYNIVLIFNMLQDRGSEIQDPCQCN